MNKRLLQPGERIRVLVVDDSVVIRRLVTHALEENPALEVVGAAANGVIALQYISQLNPDVVTLDIEMPEMDGLETLRRIRREYPKLRVIMFSTLTDRGAAVTLEALTLGADDYVTKASNEGSLDRSMARLREDLIPKIKQFFHVPGQNLAATQPKPASGGASTPVRWNAPVFHTTKVRPRVLAIGVSTGGPTALGAILPELPAGFRLPVLVVQHMPPLFTRLLAERLNSVCRLPVAEAMNGDVVESGKILIAYGGAVIAVILTGMGQDGLRGAQILRTHGASIIAQDEASSVVWGMPGAVVNAGLADCVLPLDQVIPEILRRT